MGPVLGMAAVWLLFVVSHLAPAMTGLRQGVIRRFGRIAFVIGYSLVAQALFALVPIYYATHRFEGPAGPSLGSIAIVRGALVVVVVASVVLMTAAFDPRQYLSSNQLPGASGVRPPHGLERIARHPFFAGLVLWSAAHALLSTRAMGTVFFGGFALLGSLGTLHQDRKLAAEKGPDFERTLRDTSFVPFVAILRGRQQLAWRELPWMGLVVGGGVAWLLRDRHEHLLGWNGAGVALVFFVATSFFVAVGVRRLMRLQRGADQAVGG